MTQRTVNGQTYTLGYDAEGKLVSVSGASLSAQFTYDGDGKRVKSIINNVTTYFVGNYYEVSGSTVKKYYNAGTQRVAMRENGTLSYILSDHLGSTSIITDQDVGNPIYQRYKAWGEIRYASGTLPTRYQYTGQYSYTPEFGLYFYNARWYDPALGRFAQGDSIVPEGVQGWDRYAYVNNNPMRYVDPSGHSVDCGLGDPNCTAGKIIESVQPGDREDNCQDLDCIHGNHIGEQNILPNETASPIIVFRENYCGDSSGLGCLAMLAQDVATLIDLVGMGLIEAPAVAIGCIEGGPLGCAIAEVGVIVTWNTTLNTTETAASSASLVLTIADDLLNNDGWGENSSTSLNTFVAGLAPLTPSWDLVVDGYSSGYNHEFFNGISTIWSNGLFK